MHSTLLEIAFIAEGPE